MQASGLIGFCKVFIENKTQVKSSNLHSNQIVKCERRRQKQKGAGFSEEQNQNKNKTDR